MRRFFLPLLLAMLSAGCSATRSQGLFLRDATDTQSTSQVTPALAADEELGTVQQAIYEKPIRDSRSASAACYT